MQPINMHCVARYVLSKDFVLYCCTSSTWQIYFLVSQWFKALVVVVVGIDRTINKVTIASMARFTQITK